MGGARRYPLIGLAVVFAASFGMTANAGDVAHPVRSALAEYATYGTIPVPVLTDEELAVLQGVSRLLKPLSSLARAVSASSVSSDSGLSTHPVCSSG